VVAGTIGVGEQSVNLLGGAGLPFDPISALSSLPSLTGGDAGPSFSDADGGLINATISAPFVVGEGNRVAGGGAPGAPGGGFGALSSTGVIVLAVVGGFVWIVIARARR